jgi:enoyl-CoA hydratase/carnithine racemase
VALFRGSVPLTREWDHFDFSVEEGVATVTFNRPDRLNALTFETYADLRDLLHELPHHDVAVLVITGSGRGFCSGGDVSEIIGELAKMDRKSLLDFTRMTGAVTMAMRELPMPIIAAVNGVAAGAGAVIALAADLRIMAASASFHFLFTRVGLAGGDMGAAYLLPRVVGLGRATEMLILGEKVDAEPAERIGLVNRVVPDSELNREALGLAGRLAIGPRWAVAATKSLITRGLDLDLGSAVELEAWAQALLMTSADHQEFYQAFVEKRAPTWTGR